MNTDPMDRLFEGASVEMTDLTGFREPVPLLVVRVGEHP